MPDPIYNPVKFFSVEASEADEFVTDEAGVILTDEDGEAITPD